MPPQTTTTIQKLLGGKLRLERRNANPMIYARTYLQGKNLVYRTQATHIQEAGKIAEDWWLGLHERVSKGERLHDATFADVAEKFLASAHRDHNAGQVRNFQQKWSMLKPYFGVLKPNQIDKGWLLDLRGKRAEVKTRLGDTVKPATLKKDLLFIRLVLRYAKDEAKCLQALPDFPAFGRNSKWEIHPAGRPRFTHQEYKKLRKVAWRRMREPNLNPRTKRQRTELYYFILLTTGAALRVDEAYSLRWCDCSWMNQDESDLTEAGRAGLEFSAVSLLRAYVLGKHSTNGEREEARGNALAFCAYERLLRQRGDEPKQHPEWKLFRNHHRDGFRELLKAAGLRTPDGSGRLRNLKSLRPTGISIQLDVPAQPNYIDIAAWARTSPEMIFKYYDQRHHNDKIARVMKPRTIKNVDEEARRF
jgi:hypothetical protein